ncbi:MAG: hypothetical protein E3J23_08545 [Candidatus Stahlbacteria bacterium]|nr:MAG: hypothetical protein E3J23_08545 [Candidatus Stahlbacteria bacterium]
MIFKISKNKRSCDFENEWDSKTNTMKICGKDTYVLAGKKSVCSEHLPFVISSAGKPEYKDQYNNYIPTGRVFLRKVAEYEADQ